MAEVQATVVRLRLAPGVELNWSDAGLVANSDRRRVAEPFDEPASDAFLLLRGQGLPEEELAAGLLSADPEEGARSLAFLLRLKLTGMVAETLVVGGVEQATRRIASGSFRPTPHRADAAYSLSRFAYMHREQSTMVLESPRSHWRVELHTAEAMAWLEALISPDATALDGVVTEFLAETGMLTEVSPDGVLAEDENDSLRTWEFHDLLFHDRSRRGRHDGRIGGTFRFRGQILAVPLRREDSASTQIRLPVPDLESASAAEPPFSAVLESRRSSRPVGAEITLGQLSELLYRSARAQGHDEEHGTSWRPYPTGGAVGELEVYVTVERCAGLEPGMYRYDSLDHQLAPVAATDSSRARLLDAAAGAQGREGRPAVLLTLASRFGRVSWKYEGLAYALMLKNAGGLLQTICLVATAMDMAACALGTGNSADFARATGLPEHVEGPVSEITLG